MPRYSIARDSLSFAPEESEPSAWTELGPGNIGGPTRAIVIHPANPDTMYAVAQSGGIWKTTDGGASWLPLSDLFVTLTVSTLALDPANPNVLFVGTGGRTAERFAARGVGLFKSTDGGATWAHLAATNTPDFYFVNDIVVSPRNGQRVYAATQTGVWRSLDGGATWAKSFDAVANGGAQDLAIRTDQPADVLFAIVGPHPHQVLRNADAGGNGNWTSAINSALPQTGYGRLAIAPSNQNTLYALFLANEYNNGLVIFRSTDGGNDPNRWESNSPGFGDPLSALLSDARMFFQGNCNLGPRPGSSYRTSKPVGALAVDPVDPNRLWVGGVEIFRSDNGGGSWGLASFSWAGAGAPQALAANQYDIVFHPNYNGTTNKIMFVANEGGVFRTDDARAQVAVGNTAACNPANSAVAWRALNHGYRATGFVSGAVTPDGKTYFGGTLGSGLLRGTEATGRDGWVKTLEGDVGAVAVDFDRPNVVYASTPNYYDTVDSYYPFNTFAIKKSTDGGFGFAVARSGQYEASIFNNISAALTMDPSDSRRLWSGMTLLWRTDNGAANWTSTGWLGNFTIYNTSVTAIAVAPTDANRVLAGTGDGHLLRHTAALGVGNWQPSLPRQGYLSGLAFDPTTEQIAYATYATFGGAHVWKTTDGGATWAGIDGSGATGLPDVPVNAIAIAPANNARIFIGTDLGIFVSLDGGATWAAESTLPRVPVAALVLNTTEGTTSLFAFTHGRGAWRVGISTQGGNQGCRFRLSSTGQSVGGAGGEGSVTVISDPASCAWTAKSNVEWVTINSTPNGVGNGAVRFSIAANRDLDPRTGTVAVAGRSFVITQAAASDKTPPAVRFTTPLTDNFQTDLDVASIAGTASDNFGVRQIFLAVDGAPVDPRVARLTGLTQWSAAAVPLHPGLNRLTITAYDASGNAGSASINVIQKPENYLVPVLQSADGVNGLAFDSAGTLYFTTFYAVRKMKSDGTAEIVAGGNPGFGGDGGLATAAKLNSPQGLAVDCGGNLFVADRGNHRIRKIAPSGVISTVAGSSDTSGFSGDGGPGVAARLAAPQSVAVDAAGNLFIADTANNRVRRLGPDGIISTIAGNGAYGNGGDSGPATAAQLAWPYDLALDDAGNLYISSYDRVRKVTPQGIISTYAGGGAGYGDEGAPANSVGFASPTGLAFDRAGALYIGDKESRVIRAVSPDGRIRTALRGATPLDLAGDAAGNIFVAESSRITRLAKFPSGDAQPPTIRVTSPTTAPIYTTTSRFFEIKGTASDNVLVTRIAFANDRDLGGSNVHRGENETTAQSDDDGDVRLSAGTDATITWQVNPQLKVGVNRLIFTAYDAFGNSSAVQLTVNYTPFASFGTFAGKPGDVGFNDAAILRAAQFNAPRDVVFDAVGNLYVADTGNHRIRKITPAGAVSTVAGNGSLGFSGDGGPATAAELNEPRGLAVDASGNLYFADSLNHRIRKVTPAGVITTVVGTGIEGFGGDGGAAIGAQLNMPLDVAVDAGGNLYIADTNNYRIRKVTAGDGKISTVAAPNFSGSQTSPAPVLNYPTSIALDGAGNLLIADRIASRIYKLAPDGTLTTVAGNIDGSLDEEGALATKVRLDQVVAVAVDAVGNVYATLENSTTVYRISPDGRLFFAFQQFRDTAVEDGTAGEILPNKIYGLAVGPDGKIYAADAGNHRIAVLTQRSFPAAAVVSAASFAADKGLTTNSIAAIFGTNLASSTEVATTLPLPYTLAGTTVAVNRGGQDFPAQIFFVSPSQINFLVPTGQSPAPLNDGLASVVITNGRGEVSVAPAQIVAFAPAIFSANATGQGVAAAVALRVRADGSQSFEPVAVFDPAKNQFVSRPIDLGPEGDQVFLILFGTGFRRVEFLRQVQVNIGGVAAQVLYAGAQGEFAGLDQINLLLPRSLAGRGEVDVMVNVENKASNVTKLQIK